MIKASLFGANAILLKWHRPLDQELFCEILACKMKIESMYGERVQDLVLGYDSITIFVKPEYLPERMHWIDSILKWKLGSIQPGRSVLQWEVPVCYDLRFGIDLIEMSAKIGLSTDEIIQIHQSTVYQVYFIGFLPGFLYLGGLDGRIAFPRREEPRMTIAKGSVAIGGSQTGIYPNASPAGWNVIGHTPLNMFDIASEKPVWASSGDLISFKSVSVDEHGEIAREVERGVYQIPSFLTHA